MHIRYTVATGNPTTFEYDPEMRVTNRDALDSLIGAALKAEKTAAWIAKLRAVGVPCGPINSVAEALNDPHTLARNMVCAINHPAAGEVKLVGIPFRMNGTPPAVRRPPPLLGEHTEEVLGKELGVDSARLAQLRGAKVI